MKKIFLSYRDTYYKPILYGLKMYEYRKRWGTEECLAYLYLSGKERKVVGIIEFGKPIRLDRTREDYIYYEQTLKRVDRYIENRDVYAIPIISLQLFKEPLSLEDIRSRINNFMPPQMYYDLKNNKELEEILDSIELQEKKYINEHKNIYYDNLALSVSEIKEKDEYKEKEKNEG